MLITHIIFLRLGKKISWFLSLPRPDFWRQQKIEAKINKEKILKIVIFACYCILSCKMFIANMMNRYQMKVTGGVPIRVDGSVHENVHKTYAYMPALCFFRHQIYLSMPVSMQDQPSLDTKTIILASSEKKSSNL